jgi:hypothetical protein
MYVRVLGFKESAATALYEDQQITNLDPLCKLNNPTIKELCRQIGKEGPPCFDDLAESPQATRILGKTHVAHLARGG